MYSTAMLVVRLGVESGVELWVGPRSTGYMYGDITFPPKVLLGGLGHHLIQIKETPWMMTDMLVVIQKSRTWLQSLNVFEISSR